MRVGSRSRIPISGVALSFESPLPPDFARLLALLRADAAATR